MVGGGRWTRSEDLRSLGPRVQARQIRLQVAGGRWQAVVDSDLGSNQWLVKVSGKEGIGC